MSNCEAESNNGAMDAPMVALAWPGILVDEQPASEGLRQRGPVKPFAQMQPQVLPACTVTVPPFSQGIVVRQASRGLLVLLFLCSRGRTMRTTGITTAAAMSSITMATRAMKPHNGMPQHRRPFFFFFCERLLLRELIARCEDGRDGHPSPGVVGVAWPGFGKEARMPESEPSDLLFAPSFSSLAFLLNFSLLPRAASASIHSIPSLLAVFPRSKFAASLVALRIRSGRLVKLPLASASRTASTFKRGGRRCPTLSPSNDLGASRKLGAVGSRAPPFSKPPKI